MISDAHAESVAELLTEMTDVQNEVLRESLDGRESGRTICGPDTVLDPIGRGYRSVDVNWCPSGGGGMIHGGGGHDFKAPEHSLVDVAIVLFHEPRASLVVGSESSDVFIEPQDIESAQQRFRDVLGADVSNAKETAMALSSGRTRLPETARRRARSEMDQCYRTVATDHTESSPAEVPALSPVPSGPTKFIRPGDRAMNTALDLKVMFNALFELDFERASVNVAQLVADEVVSALLFALVLEKFGR
jgi:hypothetical protein